MGGKLSYPHNDVPEDRTFLITGGNTGIGYQTAKSIAKLGGKVVIACRNEDKAKEAVEKMQKEHQEEVKKKRADEKAAAAKEKAKAEKAAAAKAATEQKEKEKQASASKKEESKKEEAKKEDGDAKKDEGDTKKDEGEAKKEEGDAKTEEGTKEEGGKEEDAKEDAPKEEEAPKEEAAKEDTPKEEDAPKEDAVKEDAAKSEEKPAEEGAAAGEEEAKEEKKEEPEEPEEPIAPLKVEYMILDLASFESTTKFIEAYKAKGYPLHVLVCNAGFGAGAKETSGDGYEMHFQVNYLSHFLMTLHLLPLLRQSAPNSRIVNVSSTLHTHGVFNLENVNGEQSYDRIRFYGNSKMYQIMSMYSFERRLTDAGIGVFSVHPGYVDSEFHRGSADNKLYSFMDSLAGSFRLKRNVQDGSMTSLAAALDTAYDGKTALYFKNCKPANPSALSRKQDNQEALWKFSVDLLKEKGLITDDLLQDLTLPEPEPQGENKPEEEAKAEDAAAAGGGDADGEKKEEAKEEKKEEKKEEGGGDASEKKEEETPKEEEQKEESPKEEEKKAEESKEEEKKEE